MQGRRVRWLEGIVVCLLVLPFATGSAVSALETNDPGGVYQWALETIGAEAGWQAGGGAGVIIAVVDSGADLGHEDLAGQIIAGHDFVDDDTEPQDCDGHGTHVSGIAAAATRNGRGVAGVAPAARIMPVRVLDCDGFGEGTDLEDGIRWAADHGAHVINVSVGGVGTQALFGPSFATAIRYAWSKGAIPVVAAGNDYVTGSGFSDEPAIVVSATTRSDTKPSYSSGVGSAQWGLAAPGGAGNPLATSEKQVLEEDVFSTWWSSRGDNQYATNAGTSMAAPHVTGAAAVLRARGLQPQQVVDRLLTTAKDVGAAGKDNTFGYGRLDVAHAVGAGETPPSAPPAPPETSGGATPATSPGTPAPSGTSPAGGGSQPGPGSPTTSPGSAPPVSVPSEGSGSGAAEPSGSQEVAGSPRPVTIPGTTDADNGDDDGAPAAMVVLAAALAAAAAGGSAWVASAQASGRSSRSRSAA